VSEAAEAEDKLTVTGTTTVSPTRAEGIVPIVIVETDALAEVAEMTAKPLSPNVETATSAMR